MPEHITHLWVIVNPRMGKTLKHNPIHGLTMNARRLIETFSENLLNLMHRSGGPASAPAVERASESQGEKIGRSSVGRYMTAAGNPTIEQLETLAKVFRVDPWKLLHPTLGKGAEAPTISEHIEALAIALQGLSRTEQREAADELQRLGLAPDGAAAKLRLAELLGGAPAPVERAVATEEFAGKPPSAEPANIKKPPFVS